MSRHEERELLLHEIVGMMESGARNGGTDEHWATLIDDAPAQPQPQEATDEDWDAYHGSCQTWLEAHANDKYRVFWPDHVITPRFNGDASYIRIG